MIKSILSSYKGITILYFFIVLANIVLMGSYLNILVTLIQYFIVFRYIGKDFNTAIFLHFSFIMTSIAPTTLLSVWDNMTVPLLSYARVKIGPVCLHYLVTILLVFLSIRRRSPIDKNSLFYKLYRLFFMLAVLGMFLGAIGFIFKEYYVFSGVLLYGIYMVVVLLNMNLLIKNYSPELIELFYRAMPPLVGGGILATAFAYLCLGIRGDYGGMEMVLQPDIFYYGILFLLGFYESKYKTYVLIVSVVFIMLNLLGATGHNIITIIVGLLYFLYYTYFSKEYEREHYVSIKKSRKIFIVLLPVMAIGFIFFFSFGDLFINKLTTVFSLFSPDLEDIDQSPYVRIATTMNIWDNNKNNIIGLLFGQGYGGYFTDSLHMFDGLGDLTDGGWPEADVRTGRFSRGHDTFATVPLLHGFGGLALILYISIRYAKYATKSYMAFAIIIWVVFTLYFNIIYAIIGMAFLFAAEKKSNYYNYEKNMLLYKQGQ